MMLRFSAEDVGGTSLDRTAPVHRDRIAPASDAVGLAAHPRAGLAVEHDRDQQQGHADPVPGSAAHIPSARVHVVAPLLAPLAAAVTHMAGPRRRWTVVEAPVARYAVHRPRATAE